MKRAADKRSEETRREYQLAITDLQRRAEAAQLMVLEYREFLMVGVATISNQLLQLLRYHTSN